MKVTIYGASDDCIEIEGDISDEIDAGGRSPKLFVYSDKGLEFTIHTSFKYGFWEVFPKLDEKSFDCEKSQLKSKSWDINISIQGNTRDSRNSMVLTIDSKSDNFEITKRRRK